MAFSLINRCPGLLAPGPTYSDRSSLSLNFRDVGKRSLTSFELSLASDHPGPTFFNVNQRQIALIDAQKFDVN